jgi:hypothetical protein
MNPSQVDRLVADHITGLRRVAGTRDAGCDGEAGATARRARDPGSDTDGAPSMERGRRGRNATRGRRRAALRALHEPRRRRGHRPGRAVGALLVRVGQRLAGPEDRAVSAG